MQSLSNGHCLEVPIAVKIICSFKMFCMRSLFQRQHPVFIDILGWHICCLGNIIPWWQSTTFLDITWKPPCSSQQQAKVWWRWFYGSGCEFWVILDTNKIWVIWNKKYKTEEFHSQKKLSTFLLLKNKLLNCFKWMNLIYKSLNSSCFLVSLKKITGHDRI